MTLFVHQFHYIVPITVVVFLWFVVCVCMCVCAGGMCAAAIGDYMLYQHVMW